MVEPELSFFFGALDDVSHESTVTGDVEVASRNPVGVGCRLGRQLREQLLHVVERGLFEDAVALLGHLVCDLDQFRRCVGREVDVAGESGTQALVGVQELVQVGPVPGDDDHQAVAVVLHPRQERVDGHQPEVVLGAGGDQRVGLVENSTPSSALSMIALVLASVSPMCWPMRSARCTSRMFSRFKSPRPQ